VPFDGHAADRGSEVAQSSSERLSNLGESCRTEPDQRDHEDKQQMRWLEDVADHTEEVSSITLERRRAVPNPQWLSRA
jgi:hypothetical protein